MKRLRSVEKSVVFLSLLGMLSSVFWTIYIYAPTDGLTIFILAAMNFIWFGANLVAIVLIIRRK
jgi:hypothetical protein